MTLFTKLGQFWARQILFQLFSVAFGLTPGLLPAFAKQRDIVQTRSSIPTEEPYAVLLGIAQDAGYPHAGCQKECCRDAWNDASLHRYAVSLAIVDPLSRERFLIECTPDFKLQLRLLDEMSWVPEKSSPPLDGLLITHAHIGHYAGLIHLGREVLGTQAIPLYAMPRLRSFLMENGPWNQLIDLNNIALQPLEANQPLRLNERLEVTPMIVPHRGEYSETVAFLISGPQRRILFLPDIDRWEDWERQIEEVIAACDVALLDGTFLADGELPGRDMSAIPHPTIEHSMKRFSSLPPAEREKIHFIHLNHTNPLLRNDASHPVRQQLEQSGMKVGQQLQIFKLGR